MTSKRKKLVIKDCGIRFSTGIEEVVARDDCYVVVAIKCSSHNSRLGFLYGI